VVTEKLKSIEAINIWLRVPRIARPERLSLVIKAFQNPVWAEQARNRLAQIKLLTHASTA
jgi:hypothetical protein